MRVGGEPGRSKKGLFVVGRRVQVRVHRNKRKLSAFRQNRRRLRWAHDVHERERRRG